MRGKTGEDAVKVTAETLSSLLAFRELDLDQRRSLARRMAAQEFAPRQLVIAQDERSTDVYFIVSGQVRATLFATNGKEVSFQDLGAGDMFGELAAIDGGPRTTHVISLTDAQILSMSSAVFRETLLTYPVVADYTFRRLTSLVRMHCERIYEYGTLGVNNRIHAEFLRLAREVGVTEGEVEIEDPPTHAEIASRVATHREAVSRECKHLEALGLIEWKPGCHVIKDVAALETMVRDVRGH